MRRETVLVARTTFNQFGHQAEAGVQIPEEVHSSWDADTLTNRLASRDVVYQVRIVAEPASTLVLPTGATVGAEPFLAHFEGIVRAKDVAALVEFAKAQLKLRLKADKPFEVLLPTVEAALAKLEAPAPPPQDPPTP